MKDAENIGISWDHYGNFDIVRHNEQNINLCNRSVVFQALINNKTDIFLREDKY